MDTKNIFLKLKIVGILHFLFATTIILSLIFEPGYGYILPLILPLSIFYIVSGYRLLTLTLRTRIWVIIPATLVTLFVLGQLPHSIDLYKHFLKGTVFPGGYVISMGSILLDLLINGLLLITNLFIIYVLLFSEEKIYFQNKTLTN